MSEDERETREDEQILHLLDVMAGGSREDPRGVIAGSDAGREFVGRQRVWVEALALLPYELEAVSPSSELKARILEGATGQSQPAPARRSEKEYARSTAGSSRWLLPLAATLAFVLVGVTGWQVWRVDRQAETIERLSLELAQARLESAELALAREQVTEAHARLEMMTASTAEYCALRPTRSCPNQAARGTLVMRSDKSDWFLRVEGLGPCEEGRQYKLWFVTDSQPVLGASFAVEGPHDLVEIRATGAPAGVTAVMITLEEPEVEAAPEAEVLLYGDQRMRIL